MNNKERLELAKWASTFAQREGADQTAVTISRSRSVDVEVREQRIETIREATDNNLYINIYKNNKYSGHSTNNLNKNQLERFISEAVAATSYLSADEDRALTDPSLYPTSLSRNLEVYDQTQETITPEKRVEIAMETEDILRGGHKDVISASGRFLDNASEGVRVHSNGFEGEYTVTRFTSSGSLTIMDGNSRPAGSWGASARWFESIPNPSEIAANAIFDASRQLGQEMIASGRYTMLIDNRIAGNLVYRLLQPMSGRNIQQKNSFLLDKIGEPIGSEKFTLIDDPFILRGMGSRLFDNDGIASRKRTMIENGVLKAYYIDNYYGRKLGETPNGGSSSNLIMGLGDKNQQQIIASMDRAILVTSFNGGNANATTGDFSFGISGQLIENGKIVKPVNEMNISGNFQDLWKNLAESGNDPNPYSALRSPTLVFKDVNFSGL